MAVTQQPKVRRDINEIAKMSPAGGRTRDRAATRKKLRRILGWRVTATRCTNPGTFF